MAAPASIPMFFGKGVANFEDKNIFMLSGHAHEILDGHRYTLKKNQNALIPGTCGTTISVPAETLYDSFFNIKPLPIFSDFTLNSNVSSKLGIKYTVSEELVEGGKQVLPNVQHFKHYRFTPSEKRSKLPSINIMPLMFSKDIDYENQPHITIELSGILRKTSPYKMVFNESWGEKKHRDHSTHYKIHLPMDEAGLELPYGHVGSNKLASDGFEALKESLKGSVLTFEHIMELAVLYKFGLEGTPFYAIKPDDIHASFMAVKYFPGFEEKKNSISLSDLENMRIPVDFFFEFLDDLRITGNAEQKNQQPYVLMIMTCRDVPLPRVPPTPSKHAAALEERRKTSNYIIAKRRQSSVNYENIAHLLERLSSGSQTPPTAAGSGGSSPGYGSASPGYSSASPVGLAALGFNSEGGRRKRTRRLKRRHRRATKKN